MRYDFNLLEARAAELKSGGCFLDALAIYLFMADGDPSLDAGHLGMRIGECFEASGDLHSACYWYGRAVEENPAFEPYRAARERLEHVSIDSILED